MNRPLHRYVTAGGTKFVVDSWGMNLYTDKMEPLFEVARPTDPALGSRFNSFTKSNAPETLRISLGQACNYSCSYCSQKDLGDPTERGPRLITPRFIDNLHRNLDLSGLNKIELWGGETLLYWPDIMTIMDNLDREGLTWYIPTNGTPLMHKHIEYLSRLKGKVGLGISHDGLGHTKLRGPEFLYKKVEVLRLLQKTDNVQFSFNPVISLENHDLVALNAFFHSYLEIAQLNPVSLNFELCRAYGDKGSSVNVIQGTASLQGYRESLRLFLDAHLTQFKEHGYIRDGKMLVTNLFHTGIGVIPLAQAFRYDADPLTQTNCGVDDSRLITLDLEGNVRVCQNTDVRYVKGNIEKIEDVRMTGVVFRAALDCHSCPVVRLCKGSCPIDTGNENFLINHNVEFIHYGEILNAALRLLFGQEVYTANDTQEVNLL